MPGTFTKFLSIPDFLHNAQVKLKTIIVKNGIERCGQSKTSTWYNN